MPWLTHHDKVYSARIALGLETDTCDAWGVETRRLRQAPNSARLFAPLSVGRQFRSSPPPSTPNAIAPCNSARVLGDPLQWRAGVRTRPPRQDVGSRSSTRRGLRTHPRRLLRRSPKLDRHRSCEQGLLRASARQGPWSRSANLRPSHRLATNTVGGLLARGAAAIDASPKPCATPWSHWQRRLRARCPWLA